MTKLWRFTFLFVFAALSPHVTLLEAQSTGIAMTPPMGWNSWNHFGKRIDDEIIRRQANAMVSSGMRDAGYRYINIDDTWQGERSADGEIQPNSKFPDMKALADYLHSKGLKLGIYSSPGAKTCAGYAGSLGHEDQDAQTYARWGVDYLKYDLCGLRGEMKKLPSDEARSKMMFDAYVKMQRALQMTGRPILYSLCEYGNDAVWRWGASVGGNLWRTTGDITDNYDRMAMIGFGQAGLASFAGKGHWNDPDMLEVGNGGMSLDEYRTHMSLWALLAAPLIAGNDLTAMSPETLSLLTNREVIAIDQDSAGKQGDRVRTEGPIEIWSRSLADGSMAIGIFNRHYHTAMTIEVNFHDYGFGKQVRVRDIWQAKDLGTMSKPYKVEVPSHGVLLLRVFPESRGR